ncbi:MAG: hypothetical protein ACYC6Y_29810, partial [Thermoguttaceae bacterium]
MKTMLCVGFLLGAVCTADLWGGESVIKGGPVNAIAAAPETETPERDDAAAVSALGGVSIRLVRDYQGVVRSAEITKGKIADADLAHLKGLPNLESLKIRGCPVGDAGLAHLA